MKLVPGQHIGNLRVESELGRGTFATVYRVRDTVLERTAVLKVVARDGNGADAALEEARLLSGLRSDHITTLYGVHAIGDDHWGIEMEHVAGGTLQDLLDTHGRLSTEAAIPILVGILQALEAAHDRGVLHGDVKPANVLLTEDGFVKLTDFGLGGRMPDPGDRRRPTASGTPLYMAPEVLEGQGASIASDLWSVGVVAWHMLVGYPPFEGSTLAEVVARVRETRPDPLPASVAPLLAAWIERCLAHDAAERPSSAHVARDALLRADGQRTAARRARRAAKGRDTVQRVVADLFRAGAAEQAGRAAEARRLARAAQIAAADLGRSWMLATTQEAWRRRRERADRAG